MLTVRNKTKKWYQDIYEMYASSSFVRRPDFDKKLGLYKFFNNDLSYYEEELNRICNGVIDTKAVTRRLQSYNKIRNKFDVLQGELLRRGNNHKIVLLTAKAIKNKNDQLLQRIQQNVSEDLNLVLSKAVETLRLMSTQELRAFIEQQRQMLTPRDINYKNFLSDVEIYKSKMLKYIYNTDDTLRKKLETFKHMFIGSEFYIRNQIRHGVPVIDVLNPLYCSYAKSGNEFDVSKSDWFRYTDEITIGQALDEYINSFSSSELEEFLENTIAYFFTSGNQKLKHDLMDFFVLQNLGGQTQRNLYGLSDNNIQTFLSYRITRTHMEFKAYDEMYFYSYKDDYGDDINVILENNTDIIPSHASRVEYTNEYNEKAYKYVWSEGGTLHEVKKKYIPQRYELTVLGLNTFIQTRKVPFQPQSFHAPISSFTLSYKGGVFNNANSQSCSRMENALPSQLQLIAIKALMDTEISKYRGSTIARDISQIPMELAANEDEKEDILTKVETIGKTTGTEYFDGEASRNGVPPSTRSSPIIPMHIGDPQVFLILQNVVRVLDEEIGMACGVSPSREGQIIPRTNVADNQQSLIQTSLATEIDFYLHDKVWNEALDESLRLWDINFKKYFEENPNSDNMLLEYSLPDGTKEVIEVLPDYTEHGDIGLNVSSTYSMEMYRNLMRMQILQNTLDISLTERSEVTRLITSDASPEEIHRAVQLLEESIQSRMQRIKEMEATLAKQLTEKEIEKAKALSDIELSKELVLKEQDKEIAAINAQRFALQQDINNNQVSDRIELEREKQKFEQEIKEKEFALKEKALQLKKEKK